MDERSKIVRPEVESIAVSPTRNANIAGTMRIIEKEVAPCLFALSPDVNREIATVVL